MPETNRSQGAPRREPSRDRGEETRPISKMARKRRRPIGVTILIRILQVMGTLLLLGVITAFRAPLGPEPCPVERPMPLAPALMASVRDASRSTLMMCACVVLFSGFTSILLGSGLYGILAAKLARTGLFSPFESAAVLAFLLEVTGGVGEAARFQCAGVFYAFGLAFGGLCVHLQVFSFFSEIPCKL